MAFLSVITRHLSSRPTLIKINQSSLINQTDADYEQIIEVDDLGRGWQHALEMLKRGTERAKGNYILVLDDDDVLINNKAIEIWKSATLNNPPGVIHKCRFIDLGVMPEKEYWGKQPEMGHIGSFSYILRREIMAKYVNLIGTGHYASDYDLIRIIWDDLHDQIEWLDQIMCGSMKRSIGRGEK